jgi:hypothetical protein
VRNLNLLYDGSTTRNLDRALVWDLTIEGGLPVTAFSGPALRRDIIVTPLSVLLYDRYFNKDCF